MTRAITLSISILFFFSTILSNAQSSTWSIGKKDNSCKEFALAPDDYENFVPDGFGGASQYYVVGESTPDKDFPYLLPGPFDVFAGYGYWSGRAMSVLPVYFNITNLPAGGTAKLIIDILEVSERNPPLFRCYVNGHRYEKQLKPGDSGTRPKDVSPHPQKVVFNIPISDLKNGINEIRFQNMTGMWCIFDAITFEAPEGTGTSDPGKTLILSAGFAGGELKNGKKSALPLHVDIRHKGDDVTVKAVVDGKSKELTMEEGHSILEFRFPAVKNEKTSDVKVFVNNELKYEGKLVRKPLKETTYADLVDQFMGTSGSRWMITPGPRMPLPMVQLSPNNQKWVWKAGYEYQVENIAGFNHTQEWTMAGFLMLPVTGQLQTDPGPEEAPDLGYRSRIDKETETARIGKYSVDLTDYNIHVDITATTRAAMQRYIFPESNSAKVLIDAYPPAEYAYNNIETVIGKVSDTEIEGYVHHICDKTGYLLTQDYKL